jgi:glycosyltransferase involved in cell wall biosynthesis
MKITVGITSYNQRTLLIEAVDSVLAQSLLPFEIIIVDDASTDDSPELIMGYAGRYPGIVRPILLAQNNGPNAARNHVLDAATGNFLTFLDGDDRWLPTKLEREVARLSAADQPDAVFSNFYFTDKNGVRLFAWVTNRRPPEGNILKQVLTLDLPRTTLFRSELAPVSSWREAGHFDTTFAIYGDWDVKVRLSAVVPQFAYVDEPLCEYRRHGSGLSNNRVEMHLEAVDHIEQKYASLISQLSVAHNADLSQDLDRFRAKLLRRAAMDVLSARPAGFRRSALRLYKQSLAFDRVLDPRLFWYLIKQ